jgi:PIN domain nuclease of toxin-antitoxin system
LKLLLDTHIWLWALGDEKRLSGKVARALKSQKNELWLSPISTWEALRLIDSGRMRVDRSADSWLEQAFAERPLNEAPLTHEVALETRAVTLSHNDPADRFLAATARVFELTLVTADERLLAGSGYKVLENA